MSKPLASTQESYFQDPSHSFVPFHDSWTSLSKNASGIPPQTSFQKVDTNSRARQPTTSENLAFSTYQIPLGAPVMASHTHVKEEGNTDREKSFTQFDIPHPGVFEPASTPAKDRIGM